MYKSATTITAIAMSIVMLVMIPASSMAAKNFVAPNRAALKFKNARCPGDATMKFTVWSRIAGPIKVELERRGRGIVGSDILRAETRKKNAYRGVRKGTVRLSRSSSWASYRIIASGNGRIRKSKWLTLRFCELAI